MGYLRKVVPCPSTTALILEAAFWSVSRSTEAKLANARVSDYFCERLGRDDRREFAALEEFVKGSSENPEVFLEEWLRPLLRHGLSLERAYEVVIESVIRPN
jgi:hypothetical protein